MKEARITLRDFLAAHALLGLQMDARQWNSMANKEVVGPRMIAAFAYELADALLEARDEEADGK